MSTEFVYEWQLGHSSPRYIGEKYEGFKQF